MSNYELNSTETRIQVTPWPLIGQPLLVNKTNTSITVKIVLDDIQMYEPVTNVSVQVMMILIVCCSKYIIRLSFQICTSDSTDRCNCNPDQAAFIYRAPFKSVDNSTQETFELSQDLQAQILYCVQSVGVYRVIERYRAEPEVISGGSIAIQTDGEKDLCTRV